MHGRPRSRPGPAGSGGRGGRIRKGPRHDADTTHDTGRDAPASPPARPTARRPGPHLRRLLLVPVRVDDHHPDACAVDHDLHPAGGSARLRHPARRDPGHGARVRLVRLPTSSWPSTPAGGSMPSTGRRRQVRRPGRRTGRAGRYLGLVRLAVPLCRRPDRRLRGGDGVGPHLVGARVPAGRHRPRGRRVRPERLLRHRRRRGCLRLQRWLVARDQRRLGLGRGDRLRVVVLLRLLSGGISQWDGSSWSQPDSYAATGSFTAVSCPTTAFCTATIDSGDVMTLTGQTWGTPVRIEPGQPSATSVGPYPTGVSCPTPTYCVAVDTAGAVLQWSGTTWTRTPADGSHLDAVRVRHPPSHGRRHRRRQLVGRPA